jgi:hypothetical protein
MVRKLIGILAMVWPVQLASDLDHTAERIHTKMHQALEVSRVRLVRILVRERADYQNVASDAATLEQAATVVSLFGKLVGGEIGRPHVPNVLHVC